MLISFGTFFRNIARNSLYVKNVRPNISLFVHANKRNSMYTRSFSTIVLEDPVENKMDEMIKDISNGDQEVENKLRILILEIDVMRQNGTNVPNFALLRKKHWEELLTKVTFSARKKYLNYLFKTSMAIENFKAKKALRREERLNLLELTPENPYSLTGNSMFIRIYEKSMNKLYNKNLCHAMLFGQKIILDCSYNEYMTQREAKNAAEQAMISFASNRFHTNPFDLYMCNVDKNSVFGKEFLKFIPTAEDPSFPLRMHSDSYLNMFPKEKLVYLTPHCRQNLVYDDDAIYIVGCLVDKAKNDPFSAAKAKEYGLKMAKLPLDNYLQWNAGSGKSLTLDQVFKILLDYKLTRDWSYAFKHVPKRKIFSPIIHNENKEKPNHSFKNTSNSENDTYVSKIKTKQPYQKQKFQVKTILYD